MKKSGGTAQHDASAGMKPTPSDKGIMGKYGPAPKAKTAGKKR